MTDLSTDICGVRLKNPTVLPAGILGVTAASLAAVSSSGAGAVTTKSIGPEKRAGHINPVVVEVNGSLLNAVGLSCPSLDESIESLKKAVKEAKTPVIASFYGRTVEEFGMVAERISEAKPALIEANISCPNIEDDFGKPFGTSCVLAAKVVAGIKNKSRIPLIVKLSPNVSDIKGIASAVEEAGADCIAAINTVGPGMYIDVASAAPVLSNRAGGMSGPAIRPIAVRCVYDIYETVDIPILGMGGVSSGRDATEMLMAGASAVGIGTAVWKNGLGVFSNVCRELEALMKTNGYASLKELIGIIHS
ncbi:MAG: dihydroorotate dehydrogenase [Candidatus Altiarchaeia archaeon]